MNEDDYRDALLLAVRTLLSFKDSDLIADSYPRIVAARTLLEILEEYTA